MQYAVSNQYACTKFTVLCPNSPNQAMSCREAKTNSPNSVCEDEAKQIFQGFFMLY